MIACIEDPGVSLKPSLSAVLPRPRLSGRYSSYARDFVSRGAIGARTTESQIHRQLLVCEDICRQVADGESRILGVMIESNLVEGKQKIDAPSELVYGQSVSAPHSLLQHAPPWHRQ